MPFVIVTDPQLAAYIGVKVGGLAIDQRDAGGGIIGWHGEPSPAPPTPYTEDDLRAIIRALPNFNRLDTKLTILRSVMHVEGLMNGGADYSSDPGRHPRLGPLYLTYLSDPSLGDALAEIWPDTVPGEVYAVGVYEPGVYV